MRQDAGTLASWGAACCAPTRIGGSGWSFAAPNGTAYQRAAVVPIVRWTRFEIWTGGHGFFGLAAGVVFAGAEGCPVEDFAAAAGTFGFFSRSY